ncbi:MAG: VOC family protein [Cellvibrionaceae bacterium]
MIGYTILGSNDLGKAVAFYDSLLALLGAKQAFSTETMTLWGNGPNKPMFAIATPYDGEAASVGNGTMVALVVSDKATVDAFYKKGIQLGGSDEGEPGMRTDNFYGAYIRDLDGNKLCVFCMV